MNRARTLRTAVPGHRRALVFLLLIACFYLVALVNDSTIVYAFCWGSVGLLIVCLLVAQMGISGLDFHRQLSRHHLLAGETVEVEEHFINRGSLPKSSLLFQETCANRTLNRYTRFQGLLTWVDGGEEVVVRVPFVLPDRGLYEMEPIKVQASDPIGLFQRNRRFKAEGAILVYPRPQPLPALLPTQGPRRVSSGERSPRYRGEGMEFHSIREYQEGDEPRRVDWKSTARTGSLFIRQFEQERPAWLAVVLDTCAGHWSPDRFEQAVTGAASWLQLGLQRGYQVELHTQAILTSAVTGFWPGLAALATLRPVGERRLAPFLRHRRGDIPRGAHLVVLTADPGTEWVEALAAILQQGVAVLPIWWPAQPELVATRRLADRREGEHRPTISVEPAAAAALRRRGLAYTTIAGNGEWSRALEGARWNRRGNRQGERWR